ncbi:hypothetical protein GFJ94_10820 [Flavobacterium sp. LMO8]|uniref:hypothetical protein n=1 Tax=Flavobacterium sp. LMO8 TaxID=2654244 RepID=UPI00129174A3|nr:hypothetical protein [Flavobacterium sp. LMO8]MQP25557.1 hypothetical protein [Flavobacterium sp. LMO8]
MKKHNLKYILAFSVFGLLLSCSDDEDATKDRIAKSVVTADLTTFNLLEGETATVTLTTDVPLKDKSDFKLELVGGTGSFRDFSCSGTETGIDDGWGVIGHKIELPAYATSTTFDISPIFDLLPEGTETLTFRLYPMGNSLSLVDDASETITVNVTNATSDDVVAVLDWSENYYDAHGTLVEGAYLDVDGDEHAFCDYDFDLEIYDSAFNVVANSYSSCPEEASLSSSEPDGEYYIVPSFWTSAGPVAPAETIFFNAKITMAKPGVWISENVITSWDSTTGGVVEGNPDGYNFAGILTKTGTTYLLEDEDGNTLASGRVQNLKNRIPRKTK